MTYFNVFLPSVLHCSVLLNANCLGVPPEPPERLLAACMGVAEFGGAVIACGNKLNFKNMPDDRYKFHFENLHGSTSVQHCSMVKVAHVHNGFCEKHLSLFGQSLLVANMTWREGGQVLSLIV